MRASNNSLKAIPQLLERIEHNVGMNLDTLNKYQEKVKILEVALRDFADRGMAFDLMPEQTTPWTDGEWGDYLKYIDQDVRLRAKDALRKSKGIKVAL